MEDDSTRTSVLLGGRGDGLGGGGGGVKFRSPWDRREGSPKRVTFVLLKERTEDLRKEVEIHGRRLQP